MSIHDTAQFAGRFCEVTAAFFVRPRWPEKPTPTVIDAGEITAIESLPDTQR